MTQLFNKLNEKEKRKNPRKNTTASEKNCLDLPKKKTNIE
jgi:hypothetical protein